MSGWKCFLIRESSACRRELRRYAEGPCPLGFPIHDASVVIDAEVTGLEEASLLKDDFDGDPRWPFNCICGRPFGASDHWQVQVNRLYSGAPDGKLYCVSDHDLPPGAMWEAPWLQNAGHFGPDGKSFIVKLPSETPFPIDHPSSDGSRWERTGAPPRITVTPSINELGRYHGHIRDGVIEPCVDGRRFPAHPETA